MSSPENVPALPPHAQVTQMLTGLITSQAIYVAAKLGVADLMKGGPRDTLDLADATKSHPEALYRLLRMLAGMGFFQEVGPRRFENAEDYEEHSASRHERRREEIAAKSAKIRKKFLENAEPGDGGFALDLIYRVNVFRKGG